MPKSNSSGLTLERAAYIATIILAVCAVVALIAPHITFH